MTDFIVVGGALFAAGVYWLKKISPYLAVRRAQLRHAHGTKTGASCGGCSGCSIGGGCH